MFRFRSCCLLLISICSSDVFGQNLVPNGDFEAYGDCSQGAQFSDPVGWTVPACCAGPGFFHACSMPPNWMDDVPNNTFGSQAARSGDGYGTFITYYSPFGNVDQYLMIELDTALQPGVEYCVRIWASRGDSSSFQTHTLHGLFTNVPLNGCADRDSVWDDMAQVTFNTSTLDTTNWSLLEATYTAVGNERWFTFGNFFDDSEILLDTTFLFWNESPYYCAMYFDDVFVGSCDVGVNEHEQRPGFKVYPNPTTERITVELMGTDGLVAYTIRDARQRTVNAGQLSGLRSVIDIGNLGPGMYWFQAEGHPPIRFIKQK